LKGRILMKRNALVLLSALLLLSVSSAVFAVGPDPLDLYADCEGWTISGIMHFGTWDHIDYYYRVALIEGMDTIQIYTGSGTVYDTGDPAFDIMGRWGMELCGDYKIYMYTQWIGQFGPGVKRREAEFTCECEPDFCTYTPGYWKNHPDAWPVGGLEVGCTYYTMAQLMDIFDYPTVGNITIKLFHHLVAAKLNVLIGADDYIMGAIMAGDEFICMHGIVNPPVGDYWDDAEDIKDELCEYNEIECEEEEEEEDEMLSISGPAAIDNAGAATQESSWGSIKKRHQ
jgi:hypothetical protein